MPETPLLGLPILEADQAQKHVTHNEALLLLDAQIHLSVLSRTVSAPPASPADGDRYLVAAGATGAWSGQGGKLALRQSGAWIFAAPREGWRLWVADEAKFLVHDDAHWRDLQAIDELANMVLLGVNAAADAGNRLTVSSSGVLFTHAGSDQRLKLNKQGAGDTASLLYQTNFLGRAEMGLAGDDDFHVKVSADGATWREAMVINGVTGEVSLPYTSAAVQDGDKGDIDIASGVWHLTRTNGSPGDGIADDAPYWNDVLAAGHTVVLSDRRSYLLKSPVIFSLDSTGIVAPMGARVRMSTAAGAFDNNVFADHNSVSSSGGLKYAVGIFADGIDGVVIEGFAIAPDQWPETGGAERYLKAISLKNCDDARITGVEASLFSRCRGIITINDCDRTVIERPYVHHCWSNLTTGDASRLQITAIDVDDNADVGSRHGKVTGGRFEHLTVGEAARQALGYQTDGINLEGTGPKPTLGWVVAQNHFYNLGEAVDCFGAENLIAGNSMAFCFGIGVKLIHGARNNRVEGNVLTATGLYAISVNGSNNISVPADGNQIVRNTVLGVTPDIDWLNADGGYSYQRSANGGLRAWSASNTSGINVNPFDPVVRLSTPINTVVSDNDIDLGGGGKFGINVDDQASGNPILFLGNQIRNFAQESIHDPRNYLIRAPIESARSELQRDADGSARLIWGGDPGNAAANASFEEGKTGWAETQGWEIVNDAANARTGNWCARFTPPLPTGEFKLFSYRYRVAVPGETIRAEAWIKTSAGATLTAARVGLAFYDKALLQVGGFMPGNNYATAQTSYVRSAIEMAVPAGAAFYREYVQAANVVGLVYADDVFTLRRMVTTEQMGGDVTASAKALLTAASASAQRTALGLASAGVAFNQSTAGQGPGFATDTYVSGAGVAVPSGSLKQGTRYTCLLDIAKSAAGVAQPVITIRFGANGTTADAALGTLTLPAQTAAADDGRLMLTITFRTVGSGSSAVIQAVANLSHALTVTGLSTAVGPVARLTSAGFNSTLANAVMGISINAGASAAWTLTQVQARLENLN